MQPLQFFNVIAETNNSFNNIAVFRTTPGHYFFCKHALPAQAYTQYANGVVCKHNQWKDFKMQNQNFGF